MQLLFAALHKGHTADGPYGKYRFRQGIAQHASTKTNYPATFIANREHDALAKAVVATPLIVGYQHAGVDKRLAIFTIAAKAFQDVVPTRRRITNRETRNHFAAEATLFQILARGVSGRIHQGLLIKRI